MEEGRPKSGVARRADGYTPVLGLFDEPGERPSMAARAGTVFDQPEPEELIELTVVVPARNEEVCLGACLESLVSQSEEIFELGKDWELVVVDDRSTDKTAEICRGHGDGGRQSGTRLDGKDERHLDSGAEGARALAAVYGRGYGS